MSEQAATAAILIIGNEVLSGRVQDLNIQFIAKEMVRVGIRMAEVRIVPDIEGEIIEAVNALRARYTYVFTTGGIGPTHDDITAESMAKAFGVPLLVHPDARALLEAYYTPAHLTPARLLMARIPKGATLINNPSTVAPGFKFENVYVMAGVPSIMQAMMGEIVGTLRHGPTILSATVLCDVPESVLAMELGDLAKLYQDLDIGSYPSFRIGAIGLALVVRGTDWARIDLALSAISELVREKGGEPKVER